MRARTPLHEPGAVLLVSCYELGHQPHGLALPLAFLERAGYLPDVLDVAVQPLDEARLRAARFVAISVPMHTALRLGVRVARRVRAANPSCHICFHGLYAPLHAGYLLRELADSVLGGECEADMVALVDSVAGSVLVAAAATGAGTSSASRTGAGVGSGGLPPGAVLRRLDFPAPSRARLVPLAHYAHLEHGRDHRIAGYTEASRGCLHACRHCPIPAVYGGRFFAVPQDVVLADVRRLVELGAAHVTFGDPDFLNGPMHALRVARAVHAAFPELSFDFTAKVEHLVRQCDLLPELAACGALFAVTAVESLSDRVLAYLHKGHARADVHAALAALRRAGIAMRPSFLPFTPWATLGDYADILDFVEAEDLVDHADPVQYTIRLLVPPGSLLLDEPAMQPYLGALDAEAFTYAWAHPDPAMDRLQRDVVALVARDAARGADAWDTFAAVRDLAQAAGARAHSAHARPRRSARAPRLTEPWFC